MRIPSFEDLRYFLMDEYEINEYQGIIEAFDHQYDTFRNPIFQNYVDAIGYIAEEDITLLETIDIIVNGEYVYTDYDTKSLAHLLFRKKFIEYLDKIYRWNGGKMPKMTIDNVTLYFKSIKDMKYVMTHMYSPWIDKYLLIERDYKVKPSDTKQYKKFYVGFREVPVYTDSDLIEVAKKIGRIELKRN